MAGIKKSVVTFNFTYTMVFLFLAIVLQSQLAKSQANDECPRALGNINVCAPFVVPGGPVTPSTDCCSALQAIPHDCVCNTLRIAYQLPARCNLPNITCGTN